MKTDPHYFSHIARLPGDSYVKVLRNPYSDEPAMLLLPAEGNLEIELESRESPAMLLCMLKCPLSPAARTLEIEFESRESNLKCSKGDAWGVSGANYQHCYTEHSTSHG